jgi:hypothetical protein
MKYFIALACALGTSLAWTAEPAVQVSKTISLFNGKDLSSFYTWLGKDGRSDPQGIFRVVADVDGALAIRISGERDGGLITHDSYADYRLITEYRWGDATWGARATKARNSGILVHCFGEDGNRNKNFNAPYIGSLEIEILEGATGDFLILPGFERGQDKPFAPAFDALIRTGPKPGQRTWDPNGMRTRIEIGRVDGKVKLPDWHDLLGVRGEFEKPLREWNTMEVVCRQGDVTVFLNGTKINEALDCVVRSGKIMLQSEGSEIFFRRVELQSLGEK